MKTNSSSTQRGYSPRAAALGTAVMTGLSAILASCAGTNNAVRIPQSDSSTRVYAQGMDAIPIFNEGVPGHDDLVLIQYDAGEIARTPDGTVADPDTTLRTYGVLISNSHMRNKDNHMVVSSADGRKYALMNTVKVNDQLVVVGDRNSPLYSEVVLNKDSLDQKVTPKSPHGTVDRVTMSGRTTNLHYVTVDGKRAIELYNRSPVVQNGFTVKSLPVALLTDVEGPIIETTTLNGVRSTEEIYRGVLWSPVEFENIAKLPLPAPEAPKSDDPTYSEAEIKSQEAPQTQK